MQKFKERFDALGDAIVAIAMTILVLESAHQPTAKSSVALSITSGFLR